MPCPPGQGPASLALRVSQPAESSPFPAGSRRSARWGSAPTRTPSAQAGLCLVPKGKWCNHELGTRRWGLLPQKQFVLVYRYQHLLWLLHGKSSERSNGSIQGPCLRKRAGRAGAVPAPAGWRRGGGDWNPEDAGALVQRNRLLGLSLCGVGTASHSITLCLNLSRWWWRSRRPARLLPFLGPPAPRWARALWERGFALALLLVAQVSEVSRSSMGRPIASFCF